MTFFRWILGGALMVSYGLSAAEAIDSQDIHPGEWQTRILHLKSAVPDPSLASVLSEAPSVPSKDADEAAWTDHVQRATGLLGKYYQDLGLPLPKGSVFAVDSKSSTLAVRTQAAEMSILDALTSFPVNRKPPKIVFQLHVLQGPASILRTAVDQARTRSDLAPLWHEFLSQAKKENLQTVRTARLEVEDGKLASVNAGTSFKHARQYVLDAAGEVKADGQEETPELRLAVAPFLFPGHFPWFEFGVEFEYHFAPPTRRLQRIRPHEKAQGTEISLTDFHRVKVVTGMSCESGMTRLLAVWRPSGAPKLEQRDVLQAAFLSIDLVPETSAGDAHLLSMLQKYADKVEPIPHRDILGNPDASPIVMKRRILAVPPDFLKSAGANSQTPTPSSPVKTILKGAGVAFPPHTHAVYVPNSCMLLLVNTNSQLNLVESFACSTPRRPPLNIRQTLQVFQADAALIQKLTEATTGTPNHRTAFDTLEALVTQGEARLVSLQSFETYSGQKANLSSGTARATLPDFAMPENGGAKTSVPQYDVFGTNLEILLSVGSKNPIEVSGHFIGDLSPALNPQQALRDSHEIDLPFAAKINSGAVRLIASWKIPAVSKSGSELMQVAFLREDVVSIRRAATPR